jgi:phenylacetate-coenzyme A ligase PaaK-like adenylate-forming protein
LSIFEVLSETTMLHSRIFEISSASDFKSVAMETFRYQYDHVPVYRRFCDLLKRRPSSIKDIEQIPFLPIEFFKSHRVISEEKKPETVFTSSGTTGSVVSKHLVADLDLYEQSFNKAFELVYGSPKDLNILALLPSYLEREGSSLIYMVDRLIKESKTHHSGFYLNNTAELIDKIAFLESTGRKTLLIGVSYALLDLIEQQTFQLKHTIVMETGGMKGRRKELIKAALHQKLKAGFGVAEIHSEYGMTELLSQAYSTGNGIFKCPPWMKIRTRDPEDALSFYEQHTGGINVIDLANVYSCSFIATQDLGKVYPDGSFEILGRFDTSDIRGCNLMVL